MVRQGSCRRCGRVRSVAIDLIPDFIPVLGYIDDLLIVPLGIMLAVKLVPPFLMTEFRAEQKKGRRRDLPPRGLTKESPCRSSTRTFRSP